MSARNSFLKMSAADRYRSEGWQEAEVGNLARNQGDDVHGFDKGTEEVVDLL